MSPRKRASVMQDDSSVDEYYERVLELLEDSYVAADERGDVFGGSGSSGDMARWEAKRGVIAKAFDRSGTWLDVGCANGLLMETLTTWVAKKGRRVEPYGLDLSERIAERARKRLPSWASRIWTGNVMEFEPPIRFDFVTALADSVPTERRSALVSRLARLYLKPGGRLILSCYAPGPFLLGKRTLEAESAAEILRSAGYAPVGEAEVRDPLTAAAKVRVAWTDVTGRS
jgi:2-polyprenyl-3-methyl-5-hydroxy-6-metoxy-1,4-benzoquinol methylase